MAVRDGIVNFYVLKAPAGLICIDAGWRPAVVSQQFEKLGQDVKDVVAVFVTHLHWDHALCISLFANADIYLGAREVPPFILKRHIDMKHITRVNGDQTLSAVGLRVRAIATPGHTPGAVSYLIDDRLLFTGDTLRLKHGQVIPPLHWFSRGSKALRQSIHKLAGIRGIEYLLTAHTGISADPRKAFRQWSDAEDGLPQGGVR